MKKHITTIAAGATMLAALAGAMELSSIPAVATGNVKGKVLFEGDKPTTKPLSVTEEQAKGCCADGSVGFLPRPTPGLLRGRRPERCSPAGG